MILNDRALPPQFIVDAIPGAEPLNAAAVAARHAISTTHTETLAAGEAWRAVVNGTVDDWVPRAGVSSAEATAAHDAYRAASHAGNEAQRAYQRALRRLHDHLRAGMLTPEFIASQEAIADAAHEKAVAAFAALSDALKDRELADGLLPRKRKVRGGTAYGLSYVLHEVEEHVNAEIIDTMTGMRTDYEEGIRLPADRVALAKRIEKEAA